MKTGDYIDMLIQDKANEPVSSDKVTAGWESLKTVFEGFESAGVLAYITVGISGPVPLLKRLKRIWQAWCGRGYLESYKVTLNNFYLVDKNCIEKD
ncbi:MAG: hypothetical protein WDA47_04935 [Bacilli bacterium]